MNRAGRRIFSGASILLAGVCLARFVEDQAWRRAARRYAAAAGLEPGRPGGAEISHEPAGDLAAAQAFLATLKRPSPPVSGEWRRMARDSMLEAAALRPGWAEHRHLLGLSDDEPSGERARRVLLLAARAAPGAIDYWTALARADLGAWPALPAAARAAAVEVFRRAVESEDFVSDEYAAVEAALGSHPARALLPENPGVLSAAAGSLAERGDIPGAASLMMRGQAAERSERERELADLERRELLGDADGLRRRCGVWFERHPFREQDDAEGRRQLARLLALWPNDRFGSWARDPRARLVRFFLDGRLSALPADPLLRTIESLTGVPDAVRARVMLASGRVGTAQTLARGAIFSPDWDAYFLELARIQLEAGKISEAGSALSKLSFGAREGCEALLARRSIARALEDATAAVAIEKRISAMREPPPEDLAARGSLSVCVDPEWSRDRLLRLVAPPGPPALLAWGWDGGRAGVVSLPERGGTVLVPLTVFAGQRTLWVSFLAGAGRPLLVSLGGPA
jgi:hypothetical protein